MKKTNQTTKDVLEYGHAHLTAIDIEHYRENLTDVVIAPFEYSKSKGVGYNFSLSELIFSINKNRLIPICRKENETYFYLRPRETVLSLSYEYIKVSDNIAGSFHSRVRTTAQGIGSISTTLDPGWSGMLLFSLNNPTNKRIKVVLTSRTDGITKRQAVSTLIAWRTLNNHAKQIELSLDNPPMRTDIWSELAAKPLKLFANKQYQKFRNLVNEIAAFKPTASASILWEKDLSNLLTALDTAFFVKKSDTEVKTILYCVKDLKNLPYEIEKRVDALLHANNSEASDEIDIFGFNIDDFNQQQREDYQNRIQLAKREVDYQVLCDQISQIHDLISKKVPTSWKTNFWANVWNQLIKNLGGIIATLICYFIIFYGHSLNDTNFWGKLLISLAPTAISIILNIFSKNE